MIIVSQDKDKIVNFNNVSGIEIYPPTDDTQNFEIDAEKVNGELDELGFYKTEERAKEVLQEIIKSYRHYRTAECDGYTNVLEETAVFEMPEK